MNYDALIAEFQEEIDRLSAGLERKKETIQQIYAAETRVALLKEAQAQIAELRDNPLVR